MATGSRKLLAEGALLGSLAIVLQQFSIAYPTEVLGSGQAASLIHLHAGLLLAIALIHPDRRIVVGCYAMVCVGWMLRERLLFGTPVIELGIGIPVYALQAGWTLLCARWMGWPRQAARQSIALDDLPRLAGIAILVYPTGLALLSAATSQLLLQRGAQPEAILQTFFAKQFGVLVLTLPLLMAWCERHSPRAWRPHRDDLIWWTLLALGLLLSVGTAYLVRDGIDGAATAGVVMMDYRFAAFLVLGWCVLRLRYRDAMIALALGMLVLAHASVSAAPYSTRPLGFLNLLHIAFELGILQIAMLYLLLTHRDTRAIAHQLADESLRDPATGLPNLKSLQKQMDRAGNAGDRQIGYLLLDRTDDLTPGYGLHMQALVMRAVAARLTEPVNAYLVGAGQFALVPHAHPVAADFWQKLIALVEQSEIDVDGQHLRLLPYLGVAHHGADGHRDFMDALRSASQLAFQARGQNELRPLFSAPDLPDDHGHRDRMNAAALALACLREGRVELMLQPICRLDAPRPSLHEPLVGEILCRLRDSSGALLTPDRFLPAIEAMGRGPELDLAVIQTLFELLRRTPGAASRCRRLSINLTGQSLSSTSFHARLRDLLAEAPLPMDALCFEITETAAIASAFSARSVLDDLRDRGCRIAIDDFGTGMQSFARLKALPVDSIKIDGSFIVNVAQRGRDFALVQACVAIARAFDAETVAEFVETDEVADVLRELGVDSMQGYLYSRPLPLVDLLTAPPP